MSQRSFEAINYMLRPNKNVERKLIVATLKQVERQFSIRDYRYIGFGSMWFTDFILMHKVLRIDDMVTIEREQSREKRVEFNKPFACITVRMESAATALGDILDGKQSLVWLDYDGPLKNALSGDVETAVGGMLSGSLILVTVNAQVEQLKGNKLEEVELEPEQFLSAICEDENFLNQKNRLTRNGFPELAAEIVHNRIKAAVLDKKPGCSYVPIWSYQYADGSEMITVGGMIAEERDEALLTESEVLNLPFVTGTNLYEISLPVLTEKEKRALDKRLPSNVALDPSTLEFELRPKEIAAYQRFYLEYPIFNEVAA